MNDRPLKTLCLSRTALTEEDVSLLQGYENTLQATADLTRADVFIDCVGRDGCAFVAAQASPQYAASKYQTQIRGMPAKRGDEPAVYRCFESGMPGHDTLANTQESKTVLQNVSPIKNAAGAVIAVLISERDISRVVRMEQKLHALGREEWKSSPDELGECGGSCPWLREIHHRTKNCMQLISSICAIKARKAQSGEGRDAYTECAGLTASVARLHELISPGIREDGDSVELSELLSAQARELQALTQSGGPIEIRLRCGSVCIGRKKALTIAIVVNELVMNAIRHAFSPLGGVITVETVQGNSTLSISVCDNGRGMGPLAGPGGGMSITGALVRDQLEGELSVHSGEDGTSVQFSCALDDAYAHAAPPSDG